MKQYTKGCLAAVGMLAMGMAVSAYAEDTASNSVLLMPPNAEVVFITTGGAEPRADWSASANENFTTHFSTQLTDNGVDVVSFDPEVELNDDVQQVLLLQEVVNEALFVVPPHKVEASRAAKKAGGDPQAEILSGITLSDQAGLLKEVYGTDRALFVDHYSQIESSGVFLMAVAVGTVTGYVPPSQNIRFSRGTVFDLNTGEIVDTKTQYFGDPRDVGESANIVSKIVANLDVEG